MITLYYIFLKCTFSVVCSLPGETLPQDYGIEWIYDCLHQIPEACPGHKSTEVCAEILGLEIGIVCMYHYPKNPKVALVTPFSSATLRNHQYPTPGTPSW